MKTYKPHPPPNSEWPPQVVAIYLRGCARIDELRKQADESGVFPIPFRCYGCDEMKANFGMMTGDGCPLCDDCLNGRWRTDQ